MAEKFGVGDFVTAQTVEPLGHDTKTGEPDQTRQGIVFKVNNDNTVMLVGESSEQYRCKADEVIVVPDENLWGTTKEFVQQFRATLN